MSERPCVISFVSKRSKEIAETCENIGYIGSLESSLFSTGHHSLGELEEVSEEEQG